MRIPLTVVCYALLLLIGMIQPARGQQITCSCENVPDKSCQGTIYCPDGCTAICAAKDTCYLSCRTDMFKSRFNLKFERKSGPQIASVLASKLGKPIEFVPYSRTANKLYNFELKNSDIWPALEFLDKRGTVKINRMDFRTFRKIQIEMKSGRKFSARFHDIPARDAVSKLAVLSRLNLQIRSGNPMNLVSLDLNEMTLSEMLKEISSSAKVKIRVSK